MKVIGLVAMPAHDGSGHGKLSKAAIAVIEKITPCHFYSLSFFIVVTCHIGKTGNNSLV